MSPSGALFCAFVGVVVWCACCYTRTFGTRYSFVALYPRLELLLLCRGLAIYKPLWDFFVLLFVWWCDAPVVTRVPLARVFFCGFMPTTGAVAPLVSNI